MVKASLCRGLLALVAAIIVVPPVSAGVAGKLTATARLEPGLWQLRDLDKQGAAPQSICIADPDMLMQVQHRNAPCSRIVIANDVKGAIVHYTCPATGFGRTSLRVETPRLARIDTQGILGQLPFARRFEARRTGACSASSNGANR